MPAIPILYSTETMTGFEYAFGGLMLANGFIDEGEQVVKAVRDRYDGERRNPWSEIECGHNYARSMASYALLNIYSGFSFDMTKKHIGFKPIKNGNGNYFWSVANSYGNVQLSEKEQTLFVLGDAIELSSFGLTDNKKVVSVKVDGESIPFNQENATLCFSTQTIRSTLEICTE
jgi:hypothetical protein